MLAQARTGRQKHGPRAHAEGHEGRPWVRWHEPHQNAARRSRRGVIADEGGIDPAARDRRHPAVGSVIGDSVVPTGFRPRGTRDLSCVGAPRTDIGGILKMPVFSDVGAGCAENLKRWHGGRVAVARGARAHRAAVPPAPVSAWPDSRGRHGSQGCAGAHYRRIRSLVFPVLVASIVSCLRPARASSVIPKRENYGGAAVNVS